MTRLTCTQLDALAPELALGILAGDERADAVAHLDHCPECRLVVADLTQALDTIVAAAPAVGPPKEFGRRVAKAVAKSTRDRPHPRTFRRPAAVAALAGALALTAALAPPARNHLSPTASGVPGAGLAAPGVRMAALVPVRGERIAGAVFVRPSSPAWVFMTVADDDDSSSTYTCELVYGDGHTLNAGTVAIRGGTGSWRQDLPRATTPITKVNVRASDGTLFAQATLG